MVDKTKEQKIEKIKKMQKEIGSILDNFEDGSIVKGVAVNLLIEYVLNKMIELAREIKEYKGI